MNHEMTKLNADLDSDPTLHWAVCECGYETPKNAEFAEALGAFKNHQAFRRDLALQPVAEPR